MRASEITLPSPGQIAWAALTQEQRRDVIDHWYRTRHGAANETALPQPQRNDGGEPCGECHVCVGETCDICGAVGKAAPN